MKTDILLISIQTELDVIGPKYLHYYLMQNSFKSNLLFLPVLQNSRLKLESVSNFIRAISPKMIGLSLMSTEYTKACYLTGHLKEQFPSIPIIWGGVHPTIDPDGCLQHADYVCVGEGEKTVLDIARQLSHDNYSLNHINNLYYKEGSQIIRNRLHPLITDLDSLPIYDHLPKCSYIQSSTQIVPLTKEFLKKHTRYAGSTYNIISSRGCPFSCTYCCNNAINRLYSSRTVRYRSVADIIDELSKAIHDNPYLQYINIQDDCFLSRREEEIQDFCSQYQERINRPFIVRSIPVFINKKKIQMLKNAGIGWISIGLQSGSDRTCREIFKRKSLKADFTKAAKIISDFKIAAFYDVILDNPFETEEDRLETINTLMETPKPFYTELFSLTFYPGTELFERASEECQEKVEDAMEKDYLSYKHNILNDITRMSTFLNKNQINRLVHEYLQSPDSFRFKLHLLLAKFTASVLLEPVTYLKVINLSHNGNYVNTLKSLPNYFRYGITRYFKQFKKCGL